MSYANFVNKIPIRTRMPLLFCNQSDECKAISFQKFTQYFLQIAKSEHTQYTLRRC